MKPKLKNLKGFGSSSKKSTASGNSNSSNSSYLAEDENFKGFATQLERLGLQLRDITGDGNCCFRALSDQLFGNESQHLDFRKRVCQYIRQNRDEFEPFVAALIDDEDDDENNNPGGASKVAKKPSFLSNKKLDAFEKYIKNLEQAGTYADNGCLVAFARLYQVNINIHQLNMPIWTISCQETNKKAGGIRELHLSYHNGEHYSSIRPLGDNTRTPTNINFNQEPPPQPSQAKSTKISRSTLNGASSTKTNNSHASSNDQDFQYYDAEPYNEHLEVQIEQIIDITNCNDINLVKEYLVKNNYDIEQTINMLMSSMNLMSLAKDMNEEESGNDEKTKKIGAKDKKNEKKERQMERQRIKVLEQREKELLALQKQSSSVTKNAKTKNANRSECSGECSSGCVHCSAQSRSGVIACSNSNNSLDLNVNLSNIETKTI